LLIPASDKAIRYCGRVVLSDGSCLFDWPGTELVFTVSRTSEVSIQMDGANNLFSLAVGNRPVEVLATDAGTQTYLIATNLNPELQTQVCLYKRTEAVASFPDRKTGCVRFDGVVLDPEGELMPQPELVRKQVIEVIGDSDTAAYGNLGVRTGMQVKDRSVFADPTAQDAGQSWAALVANQLGVDCHNISFSGMGAVWNAPGMVTGAMNEHYQRMLVAEGSAYIATPQQNLLPEVDLLVMYIGGNDWWSLAERGDDDFVDGYLDFLTQVRSLRPTQPILILLADAESGSCLVTRDRQRLFSDDMKRVLGEVVRRTTHDQIYLREVIPDPAIDVDDDADWGLMEHWSVQGNQKWAQGVLPHLQEVMGPSPA
jgi:hypothetical protein